MRLWALRMFSRNTTTPKSKGGQREEVDGPIMMADAGAEVASEPSEAGAEDASEPLSRGCRSHQTSHFSR